MANKHREVNTTIGEDSFLDTIANLVGILIIFIVIAGTGTRTSALSIARQELDAGKKETATAASLAMQLETDLAKKTAELNEYALELDYRKAERDATLDQINLAKLEIDEKLAQMNKQQQADTLLQSETNQLKAEVEAKLRSLSDTPSDEKAPILLQHLPTPMAKTVFGKEVHIMIRRQMISVVPWDDLIEALKREAELAVRRSSRKTTIDGSLGPINGFTMLYRFATKRGVISNGSEVATGQVVELDRFELEPTSDLVQESLEQCFRDGGRLRVELSSHRPQETVITAWVYEDSFETFRRLKEQLFTQGFLAAARPLVSQARIAASPHGTHSLAQ
jgi:hypothetical protein